ncbi:TRAP transporter substrate-binding protein DctP [Ramlibacter sp.]|uniref:TRAP transporter substrate-binding protein DctP n=1 Tax=Ramlibacter sp. TaxID=1917967 RepID=UPI003D098513
MKFQARRLALASALALAVTASGLVPTTARAATELTFASYLPTAFPISAVNNWMMDEIEKRTNGEIKFKRFFASTLLKAPDTFPGLASGAADMAMGAPGAYNRNDYRLNNFTLPFVTDNAAAGNHAAMDMLLNNADLKREFESRGTVALFASMYAENSYWSSKPLKTAADYKGKRIRAVQDIGTAIQKMGGTPVALSYAEAVEGLPRGVVDAVSSVPMDAAVLGGIHEAAKFGSDGGGLGTFSIGITAINKARWDKLTEGQRTIFRNVMKEALPRYLDLLNASLDSAVTKICDYKGDLVVNRFSADEKKKLKDTVGKEVHAEWIKWASANGNAGKLLEEYSAAVRKHEATVKWTPAFDRLAAKKCKVQ